MALKTKYSPLQHFSLDNLFTSFGELSPRNKILALCLVGAMVILILFLPVSLVSGKIASLEKEIAAAQKGYLQVSEKISDYEQIRSEIADLEKRFGQGGGSLSSRIESAAKEVGISVDQVREKAPQETDYLEINSLEVKLSSISIQQLMEFLYNLENDASSPMRLRRIQIKPRFTNRELLDVNCEVATFALKKEA